ncbi:flavodoxin domain-containing protein [Lacrimispora brassicae]
MIFTCGLADPSNAIIREQIQKSLDKVLSPDMRDKIKVFHFRGAMDYSKLSLMHRAMMAMVCKMLAKKAENTLTDEEKEMLANYGKTVDFTNRETTLPLINYIRGL